MKTIWITGGSSGIGLETAKKFTQNKWKVIISSRNSNTLQQVQESIKATSENKEIHSIVCDISKPDEVNQVVEHIENNIAPIDLALLNAAAYSPNKSQEFDIENYNLLIDVNLKGTLNCINALQKKMSMRKQGHIAIVSSPVGYTGLPTAGAYGMTKAGLINLAESLYFDFSKIGIKMSVINPGFIKTSSTNKNTFPMPFIKPACFAADKIYAGLVHSKKFEIKFPFLFLNILKFLRILPYPIYFYLIKKFTGL